MDRYSIISHAIFLLHLSFFPLAASNTSKRGRGVAIGFEVKKRLKSGGKIQGVLFPEERWLPVGPQEKIFKMEVGVVTRLLAPLRVFYWKDMTPALKEPLFQRLEVIT